MHLSLPPILGLTGIFSRWHASVSAQLSAAMDGLLVMEDWHNFGPDYDRTLMAWQSNSDRHHKELNSTFDERFHRMWRYYLLSLAGAFRARKIHLWQIVMSKHGVLGGYAPVR